jgi:copper(I)-binding protein
MIVAKHLLRGAAAAALSLCLGAPANAADITVKNAWMRPVRAGATAAGVYVDILTNVPLKLVGASSRVAKSAAIVVVDQKLDGTRVDNVVKEFALPAGTETRFAYNGNRIDLYDIGETLTPGASVPLTLVFVEGPDKRQSVDIDVLVRGVILPPSESEAKPN